MAIVESSLIATGFQSLLSQSAALQAVGNNVAARAYDTLAPQNPTFPLMRYQQQAPNVVNNAYGERIMAAPIWMVFASHKTNKFSDIYPIVNAFDTLLHGNRIVIVGGRIMAITRTSDEVRLAYTKDGVDYREIGLGYRVTAQQG